MVVFDLVFFQMYSLVECCTASVTNKGFLASMGQHMSGQTVGASKGPVANGTNGILAESIDVQLKRYGDKLIAAHCGGLRARWVLLSQNI